MTQAKECMAAANIIVSSTQGNIIAMLTFTTTVVNIHRKLMFTIIMSCLEINVLVHALYRVIVRIPQT